MDGNTEMEALKRLVESSDPDVCAYAREKLDARIVSDLKLDVIGPNNPDGTYILHYAAKFGLLDKVPRSYITKDGLLRRCAAHFGNSNVLHVAADAGHLNQVPIEFLTAENLLEVRSDGYSGFDLAAIRKTLNAIPAEELSPERLRLDVRKRQRSLHLAASCGSLDQLPCTVLVEKYLMLPDVLGMSTLEIARNSGNLDQLLGVELSEDVEWIVGKDWYEKNRDLCKSKALLTQDTEECDVELY